MGKGQEAAITHYKPSYSKLGAYVSLINIKINFEKWNSGRVRHVNVFPGSYAL